MPNFYETLEVPKDASPEQIKKSYRTLSLKYHPDKPGGDTAKFQEISEAYDTLSDPQKKEQYDAELNGMPFGRMHSMNEFHDINNIFGMMFGGGMQGMPGMPGMHFGGHPGMHFAGGPGVRIFHNGVEIKHSFQPQKPEPIVKNLKLSIEQAYNGVSLPIEIERCVQRGDIRYNEMETVYIGLPPGIDENENIVIQDKGHIINDTLKGDVRLVIQIENNTEFKRHGLDLHYNKTITLKEALCGFSFEIKHLNGKMLCINNNNNVTIIKPNYKKVIPNYGMKREDAVGNIIIEFGIEFPESLTEEQIEKLSNIL
jgi:DnaJ-class molecular chaperone